jgi:hypothetical protein
MTGVTAGIGVSRDRTHRPMAWALGPDRRVHALDLVDGGRRVLPPLPDGDIATVDPCGRTVVFRDGRTMRAMGPSGAVFYNSGPEWRTAPPIPQEVFMAAKGGAPVVPVAGVCDGVVWFASADRRLFVWAADLGTGVVAPVAVPGGEPIVGCDLGRKIVVCGDGSRWCFAGGGWVPLRNVTDTATDVRCSVTDGFIGERGVVYKAGEVVTLPERTFLEGVRMKRVRALREGES